MLKPGATLLVVLLCTGCSGGMQETETDEVSAASSESAVDSTESSDNSDTATVDPSTSEVEEEPEEAYLERLSTAIRSGWTRPNRPGNVPPRSARVVVFFGPRGVMQRWQFRRRSSHDLFNRVLEEYLNDLVDAPRQFPLPRSGTDLFERVMEDGALVEFADPDA